MLKEFNAATDKWIPCTDIHGESAEASLKDVFAPKSDLRSFADTPWGNLPYINLCVCIATDACRPQTPQDIQEYFDDPEKFARHVSAYLDRNKHRFYLTGKHPFLQVACFHLPSLKIESPKHLRKVSEELLKEGKTTSQLREKTAETIKTPSQVTRALLKSQVQGCNKKTLEPKNEKPGLVGKEAENGNTDEKVVAHIQKLQPEVSPIRTTNSGSNGTLNIYLTGRDLIETIICNMIPEESVKTVWPNGFGVPVYLHDTHDHTQMEKTHSELDAGLLGHLVPLTKYLKVLTPEEVKTVLDHQKQPVGDKKKHSEVEFDVNELWMLYNKASAYDFQGELQRVKEHGSGDNTYFFPCANTKAKYTRGIARPNSYLWKEFASLELDRAPLVLSKFKHMNDVQDLKGLTIHAVGMEGSGKVGLVYDEVTYESSLNLDAEALVGFLKSEILYNALQDMKRKADDLSRKLYSAALLLWKGLHNQDLAKVEKNTYGHPFVKEILREYWQRVDSEFKRVSGEITALKSSAQKEELSQDWENKCLKIAGDIVREVKDGSVRRNKAVALTLQKLKLNSRRRKNDGELSVSQEA